MRENSGNCVTSIEDWDGILKPLKADKEKAPKATKKADRDAASETTFSTIYFNYIYLYEAINEANEFCDNGWITHDMITKDEIVDTKIELENL